MCLLVAGVGVVFVFRFGFVFAGKQVGKQASDGGRGGETGREDGMGREGGKGGFFCWVIEIEIVFWVREGVVGVVCSSSLF